jgi:hypothetical protein
MTTNTGIKQAWNAPSIKLDGELVTAQCYHLSGRQHDRDFHEIGRSSTIVGESPHISPLQMLDAIRSLDAVLAHRQEARATMVRLLNTAMGQEVYS